MRDELRWTIEAFPDPTKEVVRIPSPGTNLYPRRRVCHGVRGFSVLALERIEESPVRNHELPYLSRTARTEAREPPLIPESLIC